jgi:hypothetical protein
VNCAVVLLWRIEEEDEKASFVGIVCLETREITGFPGFIANPTGWKAGAFARNLLALLSDEVGGREMLPDKEVEWEGGGGGRGCTKGLFQAFFPSFHDCDDDIFIGWREKEVR